MTAAELAAWRIGTGIPAPSIAATAASKRSSWSAVKGSSGSSATAQCVHSASRDSSGSACTSSASRTTSAGEAPTRCMPVSTLRWIGTGRLVARATEARRLDRRLGVHGDGHAGGDRRLEVAQRRLGEQQDRRGDAGGPQLRRLRHLRHRQPGRAPLDGCPGHRDGAMAVAVGLDHRAHLGGHAHRAERLDVGGDGGRGTRRPTPRAISGGPPRAPRDRVDQVGGHEPVGGSGRAGASVQPCTRGGRLEWFDPAGQEGADDPAQHVTGAGGGEARVPVDDHPHPAIGRRHDRGRALQQHDAAHRGGEGSGGGQPIRARPASRQPLELTVVGGEHGGPRTSQQDTAGVLTEGGEAVAVDDHRLVGADEHVDHR